MNESAKTVRVCRVDEVSTAKPVCARLPRGVLVAVARLENDSIVVRTMMTVTLSCDHRAVDGALGSELLRAFKSYIEDPALMLA